MVRILYGVCGEGFGHAIRSNEVLQHLKKKHEVKIITYGKAYSFLRQLFDAREIYGLHFAYKNNRVKKTLTLFDNLKRLPRGVISTILKVSRLFKSFKPDIVITDFEPFSAIFARAKRIPLISIDNNHIFTKCQVEYPKGYSKAMMIARVVVQLYPIKADSFLITHFYSPKIKKMDAKNTFLFSPILRKELFKLKPKKGDHILVYQTSKSNREMFEALKQTGRRFIIYGFDEEKKDKNLEFKRFSVDEFLDDLAGCRFILTNGGLTFITEALYLKKPILSVPIKGQFEQTMNAYWLERMGYGKSYEKLDAEKINLFMKNLKSYENNLKKYKKEDNSKIFKKLDELIEEYQNLGR